MKTLLALRIALLFAVAKVLLHLFTANNLGFQRDEFLYLALGRHLDWGYWSNPPFIGFVSWLTQTTLGDSIWATRFFPALAGGGVVLLSGAMVRDLGGGRYAQLLCGIGMCFSIVWLRAFSMFQPVCFDIFWWTLLSFLLVKWLKTGDLRWWWAIGAGAGIGFLNKYTLVFWAAALLIALLVTPHRRVLFTRALWLATGLALLIALPNLIWQWQRYFPVVQHMRELAENQLSHVEPLNFLLDQILMSGSGTILWLAGLIFLLRSPKMRTYRLLAWWYLAVLGVFLVTRGKSYYTIGTYPVLFAAGAVFWEQYLSNIAFRTALVTAIVALALPLLPTGLPIWPAERLVTYFQWLSQQKGLDAPLRWEDGEIHLLPQDYADMLGWPELAVLVDSALVRANDPQRVLIFGDNYGQTGAIEHFLPASKVMGRAVSFSDSYLLWAPDTLPMSFNALIYVNDHLGEDVQTFFADIQKIGEVKNPLARERGTGVWLCSAPRGDLPAFWAERVKAMKAIYRKHW